MRKFLLLLLTFSLFPLFTACWGPTSSQEERTFRFRQAYYADDDGWVYSFDNQYYDSAQDYCSHDPGIYPFSFRGVNLRYRYSEGYTTEMQTTDPSGNLITETVLQSTLILGNSDSQVEQRDMETIAAFLGYDRAGPYYSTKELLALTPEDLNFSYVDADIFLNLLQDCLTSEYLPRGKYIGIPSFALLTEPYYLSDYKFQIGLLGGHGSFELVFFDVLYRTGDGLTDYVQLYDIVQNGTASAEQVQLLNILQSIETGIVENNDHAYNVEEYGEQVIAGVSLQRLYAMLENIAKSEYGQYIVDITTSN